MRKQRFLFFGLFCTAVVSADCQFYDGVKSAVIKDGESVSLRAPGKSLENMKIQDQDGLGTCYANTTSTILKSVLPNSPDISYTHAAVMGTTRGWDEDWSGADNKYSNKKRSDDNFTSYGWVCETLAGLKNAGGACPKRLSAPESNDIWNSQSQKRLLNGLGLYFDNMNLIKNDPTKYDQLKNDLSLAIEAIYLEKLSLTEQCEEKRSPKFPVYEAVALMLQDTFYDAIIEPTKCSQAKAEAVKVLLSPESIVGSDRVLVVPASDTIKSFSDLLTNEPDVAQQLENFMADPKADLGRNPEFSNRLGEKLNALLMKLIPDENIRKDCPDSVEGKSVMIQDDIASKAESFLYQVKYQKTSSCTDLLQAHELDGLLNPSENKKSCLAPTNVDALLAALKPLMEIKTAINQDLIPVLLNPESRYANQIVKAIMPGCLNKDQLIKLDHLACGSFPMCDPTGKFDDNNTYSGPKGGCYTHNT